MIRGERVSWPEMIDDLAHGFTDLLDRFGPGSIGKYGGNGGAGDSQAGVVARFIKAIGSTQDYSAATIDVTPAWRVAEIVTGTRLLIPRWFPEDEDSRLVIWLGSNLLVSHGYNSQLPDPVRRIRAFMQRGGRTWVIDPKRTKSATLAHNHLHVLPDSDLVLLGWLIRQRVLRQEFSATFLQSTTEADRRRLAHALEPFTTEAAVARCGVAEDELRRLDEDISWAGRISMIIGTGVTFNRNAIVIDWLRWVLLLMTDSLDRPGGMWFNPGWFDPLDERTAPISRVPEQLPRPGSRPELKRVFNMIPVAAMVDEIRAGTLRGLVVFGGNPIDAFPEPAATTDALRRLDMLVVSDVYPSATTAVATHLIPDLGQLERNDLLQQSWRIYVAPAAVTPLAERRPMWWVLGSVARKMGFDLTFGLDPDSATDLDMIKVMLKHGRGDADAVIAGGSHGTAIPRPSNYVERILPEGRWNILAPEMLERLEEFEIEAGTGSRFIFTCGRQLRRNNSTEYVPPEKRQEDLPTASINPADAESLQVAEGETLRITSPDGSMTAAAHLDQAIRAGVVTITHGYHNANVGNLTSRSRWVDPLSGQPAMSAIPVTIELVKAPT
jgi:anaerobic selenocysteine-containing dehydrogenase